jgi:hypothetical protein
LASRTGDVFVSEAVTSTTGHLHQQEQTTDHLSDNRFSTKLTEPELSTGSGVITTEMGLRTKRLGSLILLLFGKSLEIGVTTTEPQAMEAP